MFKVFKYTALFLAFISWSITVLFTGYIVPSETWIEYSSSSVDSSNPPSSFAGVDSSNPLYNLTLSIKLDEYTINNDTTQNILGCWANIAYVLGYCVLNLFVIIVLCKLLCCIYKRNNIYPDRWLLFIQASIGIIGGVMITNIAYIYWYYVCIDSIFKYEEISDKLDRKVSFFFVFGILVNNLYLIYTLLYYIYIKWRERHGILDTEFPSEYRRYHSWPDEEGTNERENESREQTVPSPII